MLTVWIHHLMFLFTVPYSWLTLLAADVLRGQWVPEVRQNTNASMVTTVFPAIIKTWKEESMNGWKPHCPFWSVTQKIYQEPSLDLLSCFNVIVSQSYSITFCVKVVSYSIFWDTHSVVQGENNMLWFVALSIAWSKCFVSTVFGIQGSFNRILWDGVWAVEATWCYMK